MATTVKDAKRCDMFALDPTKIIVVEDLRGRHTPPTEAAIISMAESLLEHGQQNPVVGRKIGDKIQLISGFTRIAAARLIRSGFVDSQGVHCCDPDFQVRVTLKQVNDEGSFICNIVENRVRNGTTPIDDAHNQDKLRERYNKNDADIARLYGCDQSTVSRMKKLLLLPTKIQEQVHLGLMPVQAALDLQELPPKQQEKALEEATKPNGRVVAAKVREHVRDHHLADAETAPKAAETPEQPKEAPKYKRRTLHEVNAFFEEMAGSEDCQSERMHDFCKVMIGFIAGRRTAASMAKAMEVLK